MASLPATFVWNEFPSEGVQGKTLSTFSIYCLDQNGYCYTYAPLTFTVWLANNVQYANANTGLGTIATGSVTTAITQGQYGMATFDNITITQSGNYTLGCCVTSINGGPFWPAQNISQSPPFVVNINSVKATSPSAIITESLSERMTISIAEGKHHAHPNGSTKHHNHHRTPHTPIED